MQNEKDGVQAKVSMAALIEEAMQYEVLLALSESARKIMRLGDRDAAAYIGKSHSTLAHARSEQSALSAAERDSRSCGCIPYIKGPPIQYRLYDLLIYKVNEETFTGVSKTRSTETKEKTALTVSANAQKNGLKAKASREAAKNATYRGFSSFMQTATAADTWPFSMQKDGRPMDLYAAMLDGKLTGNAERLNLREFSSRLADAATQAYSDEQARALESGKPLAKDSGEKKPRTDRWTKSGGPV